ncbi:hypothetical protein [Streptomyces sp. NBC_01190]|uniref:hypothetical protein n=1 Tax=Streptomyces sp. NBC_01190 TaxID=2903767 RepID=UPI00387046AA|nr:hypothetical protein OG519_12980 [Streptomyces sp. NBC_01190]
MGVESDRLVFDYLSRIGDLAQTALPAAQRMQLVARLRTDIAKQRGGSDSPAAVRRILDRIGSPDAVVDAAAERGGTAGSGSGGSWGGGGWGGGGTVPPPGAEAPTGYYGPYRKPEAAGRPESAGGAGGAGGSGDAAGPEGPGDAAASGPTGATEWWRVQPAGGRPPAGEELAGLPGMTGGVTIPLYDEDLVEDVVDGPFGPRVVRKRLVPVEEAAAEEAEGLPEAVAGKSRWWPRLPGRGGAAAKAERAAKTGKAGEAAKVAKAGRKGWGSPVLLLAAALLVAGAAIGSLIPMGLGWLLGYFSRRLSRQQAKFGILGIPGTAALGMLVWLWGRDVGKWSTPIADGKLGEAIQDALPATIRLAAIGSALYLLWRSRRTA